MWEGLVGSPVRNANANFIPAREECASLKDEVSFSSESSTSHVAISPPAWMMLPVSEELRIKTYSNCKERLSKVDDR